MNLKVEVDPRATSEERIELVRQVVIAKRAHCASVAVQTVAWLSFFSFLFWLACAL